MVVDFRSLAFQQLRLVVGRTHFLQWLTVILHPFLNFRIKISVCSLEFGIRKVLGF